MPLVAEMTLSLSNRIRRICATMQWSPEMLASQLGGIPSGRAIRNYLEGRSPDPLYAEKLLRELRKIERKNGIESQEDDEDIKA